MSFDASTNLLGLAFVTGVTTGGLSCLAVQAGLLATSVARQAETDVTAQLAIRHVVAQRKKRSNRRLTKDQRRRERAALATQAQPEKPKRRNAATPIALFLGAKLVAYTLLGIFLGWIGSTQAMMVLAVGTGSPLLGAAIMFAFILGTTPVFFGLAYVATRLGEVLHTRFLHLAGAVVLILGLVSIEGGLNLMGSPYSFSNLLNAASVSLADASGGSAEVAAQPDANGAITIQVYNTGYSPDLIKAPSSKPVSLTVVSNGTTGCTRGFVIPAIGFQRTLPETGQVTINIPASAANGNLRYTCSMGMYSGYFEFT